MEGGDFISLFGQCGYDIIGTYVILGIHRTLTIFQLSDKTWEDVISLLWPYFFYVSHLHGPIKSQPRWLSGLRRSHVHSLMIARRSLCPEQLGSNPGQGKVKGLISRAGMVSICPLL